MISDENLDTFLQSEIPGISLEDLNVDEKRALASSLIPSVDDNVPPPPSGCGEAVSTEGAPPAPSTPPSGSSAVPAEGNVGDGLEDWQRELVNEFMEITGAEQQAASSMLEAFGYDMDGAMVMFMEEKEGAPSLPVPPPASADAGTIPMPPSPGMLHPSGVMEGFGGGNDEEDLPRNSNELDEFGIRRPDQIRRNQRLISSNTSGEAIYDDIMGRAEDENVDWMFPPPAHLSFAGNLDMASDMAESDQKWLLVNLQHHEEFSSHMLNRDTWCDDTVEQIVRNSFIFWQRGSTCQEAKKYLSVYKVDAADLPQTAIIDPRTRAKITAMKGYASPTEMISFLVRFIESNDICGDAAPKATKATQLNVDLQHRALFVSARAEGGGAEEETPNKLDAEERFMDMGSVARSIATDIASDPDTAAAEGEEEVEDFGPVPAEPPAGESDTCRVQLKLPTGKPVVRRFFTYNTVREVHAVARAALEERGDLAGERIELASAFPVRVLSGALENTIEESGVMGAQIVVRKMS
jgi:hypothetical protein